MVSTQPKMDLPLKNSSPIPISIGKRVMPKALPPPANRQNEVWTVTRPRNR